MINRFQRLNASHGRKHIATFVGQSGRRVTFGRDTLVLLCADLKRAASKIRIERGRFLLLERGAKKPVGFKIFSGGKPAGFDAVAGAFRTLSERNRRGVVDDKTKARIEKLDQELQRMR